MITQDVIDKLSGRVMNGKFVNFFKCWSPQTADTVGTDS